MSESKKGENHPFFGKHHSEETRKKIGEAKNGKHLSAETRKKMSETRKGKSLSAETRKKMSEARKGSYFFNNGVKSIRAKTCPEGFVKGRIKQKKERAAAKQTNEENKQKAAVSLNIITLQSE